MRPCAIDMQFLAAHFLLPTPKNPAPGCQSNRRGRADMRFVECIIPLPAPSLRDWHHPQFFFSTLQFSIVSVYHTDVIREIGKRRCAHQNISMDPSVALFVRRIRIVCVVFRLVLRFDVDKNLVWELCDLYVSLRLHSWPKLNQFVALAVYHL